MKKIKIGIIGVGNCASSLIQGIEYYSQNIDKVTGLIHSDIGGYAISDIEVTLAIDIDERKVGKDVSEAIFCKPNNTTIFYSKVKKKDCVVIRGVTLDGISDLSQEYDEDVRIIESTIQEPSSIELIKIIKDSEVDMLVNYLPVGAKNAAYFYADCAIKAKVGFINCMPVFIASDNSWIKKFRDNGVPCIGDDIKSQIGATIIHRELVRLFEQRGIKILHTYQLNTGGNTDFLNMLDRERLTDKRKSKTSSVQSNLVKELNSRDIHIGPSDYIPWLKDNKICFLRIEGLQFGEIPMNVELRLSVEDSPNSAGVVVDAIRCMKIAIDRGMSGNIIQASSYYMKHPPVQVEDFEGRMLLEKFIENSY